MAGLFGFFSSPGGFTFELPGLSSLSGFTVFSAVFKGDITTRSDANYENSISRFAANAVRRAQIVAHVKDAEDVARAIAYARMEGLPFAVRGGGYSITGASSVEDGLVVDLSRYMNSVKVDEKNGLAFVGGGAVWRDVDRETMKYGLATVGGTVNQTGVGGHTLEGGYGWITGRHGLTIDNLVQATVVTTRGEILTTNAKENANLFWGIRAGTGNFGVVTEFVFRLHKQRRTVFCGMIIYTASSLDALLQATLEWIKTRDTDKEAMVQVMTRSADGYPCIAIFPFYNGSETEGRRAFKVFLDLGPLIDECKERPYEEANTLFNPSSNRRSNFHTLRVAQTTISTENMKALFEKYDELTENADFMTSLVWELFPLDKVKRLARKGTEFPCLGDKSGILVIVRWAGEAQGNRAQRAKGVAETLAHVAAEAQTGAKTVKGGKW